MPRPLDIDPQGGGERRAVEWAVAELATRQHGVVARRQLLALGLGRRAIECRQSIGRLHRVHRGVYAVGHRALTPRGRWMAAVLACGPHALLSHRSAAQHWGLLQTARSRIDVLVPSGTRRGRRGIDLHHARSLTRHDRGIRQAIPVTSPARTLVDLAGVVNRQRLADAVESTEKLELFDLGAIDDCLDRAGRTGTGALRSILRDYRDPGFTRSWLERRFVDFLIEFELPMPVFNSWVLGYEVDAIWREQRLVVELDGYEHHRTRAAFERDRERDIALQATGIRVLRVTKLRLERQRPGLAATLKRLLPRYSSTTSVSPSLTA